MTVAHVADVPSPRGLPVIGHAVPFARDPLAFLTNATSLGPIVDLRLFGRRYFLIRPPELIHEALVRRASRLRKDKFYDQLRRLMGEGLATSENPLWRRQRKLVSYAFTPKHIRHYGQYMIEAAQSSLDRWSDGQEIELQCATAEITMDIIARSIFGEDVRGDHTRVFGALTSISELWKDALSTPFALPKWWPTPKNFRFVQGVRTIDAVIANVIEKRRRTGHDNGDFLSALLFARDDEGKGMDDRQIRDECMTMFVAGQETSGLGLMYTLYLIAKHPEIEAGVREELSRVVGNRLPTIDDIPQLELIDRVIKESLRLYPPAWVIARTLLDDWTFGGAELPKGTSIMISPWVTHRDPDLYADPTTFRPDRWLEERSHKLAFMPFGAGHRSCIGGHFAMVEMVLITATLLQQVRLECITEGPLRIKPSLTLRPAHEIRMRVRHDPIQVQTRSTTPRRRATRASSRPVRPPVRRNSGQQRRPPVTTAPSARGCPAHQPASNVSSNPEQRHRNRNRTVSIPHGKTANGSDK